MGPRQQDWSGDRNSSEQAQAFQQASTYNLSTKFNIATVCNASMHKQLPNTLYSSRWGIEACRAQITHPWVQEDIVVDVLIASLTLISMLLAVSVLLVVMVVLLVVLSFIPIIIFVTRSLCFLLLLH